MSNLDNLHLDKSKVYVAFTSGTTIPSRLIMWFTYSKYSHSCLIHWSDQWNGWLALGAESGGWIYTPIEHNGVVDMFELPVDLWPTLQKYRTVLSSSYDFRGVLGMTMVELFRHWFKRKVRNLFLVRGSWFCSEIVTKILQDAGLTLAISPGESDSEVLKNQLVKVPGVLQVSLK